MYDKTTEFDSLKKSSSHVTQMQICNTNAVGRQEKTITRSKTSEIHSSTGAQNV